MILNRQFYLCKTSSQSQRSPLYYFVDLAPAYAYTLACVQKQHAPTLPTDVKHDINSKPSATWPNRLTSGKMEEALWTLETQRKET